MRIERLEDVASISAYENRKTINFEQFYMGGRLGLYRRPHLYLIYTFVTTHGNIDFEVDIWCIIKEIPTCLALPPLLLLSEPLLYV